MLFCSKYFYFLYLIWSFPPTNHNNYHIMRISTRTSSSKNIYNNLHHYRLPTNTTNILHIIRYIKFHINIHKYHTSKLFIKYIKHIHNYRLFSKIANIYRPLMTPKSTRRSPNCWLHSTSSYSIKTRWLWTPPHYNKHSYHLSNCTSM